MAKGVFALFAAILLAGCGSDPDPSAGPGADAGADSGTGGVGGGDGGCACAADKVVNSGHRGTGTNSSLNPFPENTIESIKQAFAEGAEMSELDVVHSKDGVLVVIHDDTVNRTTNGTGCVGDLTVAELQGLDAAVGTSLAGTGVKIPTLTELLAAVDGGLNIEIKLQDNA
ncbi:MAG TPA: glycerophosphodiester phosphodiesterase family protein, partial [Polyangiaceae bacterium]|nr:glycerophosphodiester phosphodiesterase family protein [Polyangiaceae bacterium]